MTLTVSWGNHTIGVDYHEQLVLVSHGYRSEVQQGRISSQTKDNKNKA